MALTRSQQMARIRGRDTSPERILMPKEFREWFEQRGFTGEMDINKFCIRLRARSEFTEP